VQVNKDAKEAAAAANGKPKVAGSPTPRITFDLEGFREAQLAADAEAGGAISRLYVGARARGGGGSQPCHGQVWVGAEAITTGVPHPSSSRGFGD
jgi:hypothetical protein